MCAEFYDKYEEYINVVNERKERSNRNYNYSTGSGNVKVEEAVKAAAEYNKKFNEDRRNQRSAYFDMQTFTCHYPKANKGNMKVEWLIELTHWPAIGQLLLVTIQHISTHASVKNVGSINYLQRLWRNQVLAIIQ